VENKWYACYNNKDKIVLKVNSRKAHTLRLINPKHHIYYVISALDMTKLNHRTNTIGYSTYSSMGYTTQSQLPTAIDQPEHNQPKPSHNPLILWGFQTTHNREHYYHDSRALYRGLCHVPMSSNFITFQRLENLHVVMPAKAQLYFLWCEAKRSLQEFSVASFSLYIPTEVSPLEQL
jgi:hypothetical protein